MATLIDSKNDIIENTRIFNGYKADQPTYRGMRVNGVRVQTWSCRDGWHIDAGKRGPSTPIKDTVEKCWPSAWAD
jgi:hypothetical protein